MEQLGDSQVPEHEFPIRRRRNSAEAIKHSESSKVLSEKLIFYCSDFDLNVNDWYNEFENIHIFKKRVGKALGNYPSLKPYSPIHVLILYRLKLDRVFNSSIE